MTIKMKRSILLSVVLLSILRLPTSASGKYNWFHHIHTSSETVRSICPDPSGRVWFGTMRGLLRYGDNQDSIHYDLYPDAFNKGVYELSLFAKDRLLVKTQPDSIFVYNTKNNTIECDLNTYLDLWDIGLAAGNDLRIKSDADGNFLCHDESRIYWKDADKDKAVLLAEGLDKIYDVDIYDGAVSVLTDSLLYILSLDGRKSPVSTAHGLEFHRRGIWVEMDGEGNVWVGSKALYRFEKGTLDKECIIDDISIMDILRNRSGDILVATGISGIIHLSSDGKIKQKYQHGTFDSGTLVSNNILHLSEGHDGSLWVCYDKPVVSVCQPGSLTTPRQHIKPLVEAGLEENVISLAQAPDGMIWFGTDGQGIWCQHPDDGSFHVPDIHLSQPSVTSLYFDSKGRAWVGTYLGGIYCQNANNVRRYLHNSSCYDIIEDSNGNIWAGIHGIGVCCIPDGDADVPVNIDLGAGNWVFCLAERDGVIYAATTEGLFSINMDNHDVRKVTGNRSGTQSLQNTHFKSVMSDSRGLLWLTGNQSDHPLEIYDISRDKIMHIPQLEGQIVKSIVEDNNRTIWLATEEQIIQIFVNHDSSLQEYYFQTSEYIFRREVISRNYNNKLAGLVTSQGSILFGGTAGYLQLYESEFPPITPITGHPSASISSLKVNDEHITVGKPYEGNVILKEDIAGLSEITLKYNQNNVSLGVFVKDYAVPFEIAIYYRMSQDGDRWKRVRGNIIELNRLSSGSYVIDVCSGNPDGTLSSEICSFTIKVLTPWYASKLAFALYFIVTLSGISLFVFYYIERQKQKLSLVQIQQEAERQQQMNDMKLRFFTNISHDFRTPLTLIITPLETRLAEGVNDTEEKFLRPIYRNAVRLLTLVNQVLDLRKLETVGTHLNLSYGDIVSFLSDICLSFELFADETDRKLSFSSEHKVIMTSFDKDKLSKVIMNLLSNAFKYTPEHGLIVLSVSIEGPDVIIKVSDNGPGIPDIYKTSIFERFFQYQQSSTQSGSGIGLHIAKEFVDMHEGSIMVADNVPTGSTFIIRLPISETGSDAPEIADESHEDNTEDEATGQTNKAKQILIVEDNADFRDFLKTQLSDQYQIFTACNGHKALEILSIENIDIIISDVMMDGMDGMELCRKVKTDITTSHIPFIMLTAKVLAEDELAGLNAGADDYLTKPFNMQILRTRIHKLLEAHLKYQNTFSEKLEIRPSEITITSLDEQFLAKAIQITEEHMSETDFSVDQLSRMLGMHRANLYKKLLSLTGKTPVEFIRLIRLKRAAQYLAKSQMYVFEVAYRVGFKQAKIFSQHFKEEFGMTPREYQKQYQEDA